MPVTSSSRPSNSRPSAAELNRGLSNGVELAGVVVVFFLIGFGLDKAFHTGHWFMLGFTVFGIVGSFVRAYYAYTAEMDRLDRQRRTPRAGSESTLSPTNGHAA